MRGAAEFPGPGVERRQQPVEIEIPGLDDVGYRLGVDEEQLAVLLQFRSFQPKLCGIRQDAPGRFLEGDEDAGLLARARAMRQELQREYGLAGAWPAHQQRRAAAGQAPAGDRVESGDACRGAARCLGRRFLAVDRTGLMQCLPNGRPGRRPNCLPGGSTPARTPATAGQRFSHYIACQSPLDVRPAGPCLPFDSAHTRASERLNCMPPMSPNVQIAHGQLAMLFLVAGSQSKRRRQT